MIHVNYFYDYAGALTSIKEKNSKVLVSYNYDNAGRLSTMTRHNGVTSSIDYTKAGNVFNFNHNNINDTSFDYNPANQIVRRVVNNNNFQIKIPSISQETYEVNNLNQYESVGTKSISYDNAANLTTYDGWTYRYNAHNRLTSAIKSGKNLALTYDPTGRLESSTLNGSKTHFLYDGNELIAEYNSSGNLVNRYVHGIGTDDPLVWYTGSGTTATKYLLANERGSIIAETNNSGTISTIHQYGPYGEPMNNSTSRFRYTGQILLPGTELYYYKARVYHPKLGRFMQTDPIGYEDGMNMYAYVGNDPVNNNDPTGTICVPCAGFVVGFALDIVVQVASGTDLSDVSLTQAGAAGIAGAVGGGIGNAVSVLGKAAGVGKVLTSTSSALSSSAAGTVANGGDVTIVGTIINATGGKLGGAIAKRLGSAVPVSTKGISAPKPAGSANSRKHNRKNRRQVNQHTNQVQSERAIANGIAGSGAGGKAADMTCIGSRIKRKSC